MWVCLRTGEAGRFAHRCTGLRKWQAGPEDVCWRFPLQPASPLFSGPLHPLPTASLLQPAGEESVAPYGARKINNEEKISTAAGSLYTLSHALALCSTSPPNKIQRCRERERRGVIKLMGFNTLTQHRRQYLHRTKKKNEREISSYSSVILWYYKSDPGLSILRPCFINVH